MNIIVHNFSNVKIGKSIIDFLVEGNGNWKTLYMYNHFGYHILFLLPNFCENDKEDGRNRAIEELADGIDEEIFILDSFLRENPETPFIITGNGIDDCISKMKDRLNKYIKQECAYVNCNKFFEEWNKFEEFLNVVYYIESKGTDMVYNAYYNGWKSYIEESKK